jgi:hypothetical protein
VPQRQQFGDDGTVVEASGARAEFRTARDPGLVDVAPQLCALCAGHDGHVGRLIELEQPAGLLRLVRIRRSSIDGVRGQAGKFGDVRDAAGVGLARIQHVLGKLGAQLRQPLHHLAIAGLAVGWKIDAREAKVAQSIVHHLEFGGFEDLRLVFADVGVGGLQCRVLTQLRVIRGQQRDALVVGLPHRGRIRNGVQMPYRTPDAVQSVPQFLDRHHQRRKGRRGLSRELGQARAVVGERFFQGRPGVGGLDQVEARQGVDFQQRVVHAPILADVVRKRLCREPPGGGKAPAQAGRGA